MVSSEIAGRLQRIFDEIFFAKVHVTASLSAQDITEWDSIQHVKLILAVEREFGIRFTLNEVAALQNVGDLMAIIQRKLGKDSPPSA